MHRSVPHRQPWRAGRGRGSHGGRGRRTAVSTRPGRMQHQLGCLTQHTPRLPRAATATGTQRLVAGTIAQPGRVCLACLQRGHRIHQGARTGASWSRATRKDSTYTPGHLVASTDEAARRPQATRFRTHRCTKRTDTRQLGYGVYMSGQSDRW